MSKISTESVYLAQSSTSRSSAQHLHFPQKKVNRLTRVIPVRRTLSNYTLATTPSGHDIQRILCNWSSVSQKRVRHAPKRQPQLTASLFLPIVRIILWRPSGLSHNTSVLTFTLAPEVAASLALSHTTSTCSTDRERKRECDRTATFALPLLHSQQMAIHFPPRHVCARDNNCSLTHSHPHLSTLSSSMWT